MINYYATKSQPITKLMVWEAYQKVRANKGSGGIDKMTWEILDKNPKHHLYKLWNRLTSGSYFPQDVKQVEIPKKDGGVRKLGIPTLLDRIAQQVAKSHLEPIVEKLFHTNSYGYRPNRSCHQAIERADHNCNYYDWVIDLDIKGFFDNIDHEMLMKAVKHYCNDKWILLYTSRWLKSGIIQKDGLRIERHTGTPQGGVISPLLANIYLHVVFDKWIEKYHPEKPFERYADDVIVHCKTEKQAKYVLKSIQTRMESCKLTLHPVKTKIVNLTGLTKEKYPRKFDYLGYTFKPTWSRTKKRFHLMIAPVMSMKSKKSVMEKLRELQIHKMRKKIDEIAQKLNPILTGIINYYCKFMSHKTHLLWYSINQRLTKWVRWQKKCSVKEAVKYLRIKWKEQPNLFAHWKLVHP
jgi:group II intron reverse transcriptase/maturase